MRRKKKINRRNNMKYPDFIKEKDCIGVPSPSAGANTDKRKNKKNNAKTNLEKLRYNLVLSDNLFKCQK